MDIYSGGWERDKEDGDAEVIGLTDVRSIFLPGGRVRRITRGSTLLWQAPTYKYVRGEMVSPNGILLNNYSEGSAYFLLDVTFRCNEYGAYIYKNDSGSGVCRIYIGEDGYLHFDTAYNNVVNDLTFIELGRIALCEWYHIRLRVDPDRGGTVEIVGKSSEGFTNARYFAVKSARSLYIGSDKLDLRGRITVIGTPYSPSTRINELSFSVDDSEDGAEVSFQDENFNVSGGRVYTDVE